MLIYGIIKLIAYSFWVHMGFKTLNKERVTTFPEVVVIGALRLAIGMLFGFFVFIITNLVLKTHLPPQAFLGDHFANSEVGTVETITPAINVLLYVLIYAPIRWIEWALMTYMIAPKQFNLKNFLMGANKADRYWRLGGILISYVADAVLLLPSTELQLRFQIPLPRIGRIFC